MKMQLSRPTKRLTALLLAALLTVLVVGAAAASGAYTRTIGPDERIDGDVTVFNDDFELLSGSSINGDVVVMRGDAFVDGRIDGDLVLFNGDVTLTANATISGDCVLLNGEQNNDGANISCVTVGELPAFAIPEVPDVPGFAEPVGAPESRSTALLGRTVGGILTAVGNTLVLVILGAVAAALAPNHLRRVADAASEKPVATGTVGILTAVAVPALLVLLALMSALLIFVCVGLLGIPIIVLVVLGYLAALVFGWLAIGKLVGDRLATALKMSTPTILVRTVLGTAVLTLVIGIMGVLPIGDFLAPIVTLIIGAVGLGAVTLTKFGTRAYPLVATPDLDEEKVTSVLDTLPADEDDSAESAPSTE